MDDRVANWCLCITAVLLAFGFMLFPHISDDLNSIYAIKGSYVSGLPIDWEAYCADVVEIFKGNHFRLPNLLMPLVALLPRWIPALISGVAIYVMGYNMSRLCSFSVWGMMCFLGGFVFLFPWIDQMYLTCFQMPYIWGAAMATVVIRSIFAKERCRRLPLVLLCVVLGFWQEAYAGAVLGGCVCLAVFYKRYRTPKIVAISAALFGGILVTASPLLVYCQWTAWEFFAGRMWGIYPFLLPGAVYLAVFVVMACKKRMRGDVIEPYNLFLAEVVVSSALMTLYFKTGARVNGLGIICALAGIVMLLGRADIPWCGRWFKVACVVFFALSNLHVLAVDCMCGRLGRETAGVVSRIHPDKSEVIFSPLTLRENAPWYLLQKPYYDWFAHRNTVIIFECTYMNCGQRLLVVPEQLRQFTPTAARLVDGDAGIYVYDGYMVATECILTAEVQFGAAARAYDFHVVPFVSEADGREYYWMHINYGSLEFQLHPEPLRADKM